MSASDIGLEEAFVTSFDRTVKSHNCITVGGTLYELPLGHRSGERIDVYRNMITGTLSVHHQGERVTIHPADLTANAYQERSATKPKSPTRSGRRRTAADAAFNRDHPPLVDDDGGYHHND